MKSRLRRLKYRSRTKVEAVNVTMTGAGQDQWVALKDGKVLAVGATTADLIRGVRQLGESGRGATIEHRGGRSMHPSGSSRD